MTRLWERIHPFPGSGREHTWHLLLDGLRDAETHGHGRLTTARLPGVQSPPIRTPRDGGS